MPLLKFKCKCGAKKSVINKTTLKCAVCGLQMFRDASGPTTQIRETLDNGLMDRELERHPYINELAKDRSEHAKVEEDKAKSV